ncbi:hypothetical protein F4779DRAFT_567922 [Xylariaceae sp. FL0662B]|nr:hypothetical protein F4779DRAFT_567922 [Xylariaceae sp. FL0662B]
MPGYTITEPHPTVVKNSYTHSGRGGAGNFFRAPATTPACGVPTQPITTPPVSTSTGSTTVSRYHSGRGGAGNARVAVQKPVLSFDEEFARQSQLEQKPVGHVGRGGAGNVYNANATAAGADVPPRKGSDASSQYSGSSAGSRRDGFWTRLSQSVSRHQ